MNPAPVNQHSDTNELSDQSATDHAVASTDAASSKELEDVKQLSIIVVHEDRAPVQALKEVFKDSSVSIQIHRITSLEDLSGSLQVQDWDVICCFSHSSEFDPQKVCEIAKNSGNGASAIYIDTGDDTLTVDTVLGYGFTDHLSADQPSKICHSIFREAAAARNARLVQSNLDLIEEYNRKNALLLNASTDAIAYLADGMIMHGNQAFVELLAFNSLEDLVWQSFIDFISDDGQHNFKAALRAFRKNPDSEETVVTTLCREDDSVAEVSISFASATHEGEACTQVVMRDLSVPEVEEVPPPAESFDNNGVATPNDTPTLSDAESVAQSAGALSNAEAPISFADEELINNFARQAEEKSVKGHVVCLHINSDKLYTSSETINDYNNTLSLISTELNETIKDSTNDSLRISISDWLVSISSEEASEPKVFAESIIKSVGAKIEAQGLIANNGLLSIGSSPFGIADIDPKEAISKAFGVCIQKTTNAGGFGEYEPRISDSASSSAILSALELERLSVKFQPIIALQGQSIHLYDANLYMMQDDSVERPAHSDMRSLGVEEENTQLDKWFFSNTLEALKEAHVSDANICINIPVTASGIVHKDFFPDIMLAFEQSGLPKSCISFSANIDVAEDFPEKTIKLFSLLRQAGFNTTLENVGKQHKDLFTSIRPCYVYIDPAVSNSKTNEEWRQDIREIFEATKSAQAQCIVCDVSSAADLAQIWQSGAPFVKGSYLQEPMSGLNYEFSDLN